MSEFAKKAVKSGDKTKIKHVNYREYMQSKAWQKVRRERFQKDGYRCQLCGTGKNLQAHHISYEHLGQDGELEDLVTLCRRCHREVHDADQKNNVFDIFMDALMTQMLED